MSARRIVVLGSTGSIGTQVLEVCAAHPDRFQIVGLAAGGDVDTIAAQAARWSVADLALADPDAARGLRAACPDADVRDGLDGVVELAAHPEADLVVNAVTGARGLRPTLAALAAGIPVALANKESLIVGGDLVVAAAEAAGGREAFLIPVDSEHSALAQCLRGGTRHEVARLVLTASGGPFRGRDRAALADVTVADALAHPTWDMGPVITINSATLVNKGLEVIEAHLLFGIPYDRIEVVVHPTSVVHSMVEFVDGSTMVQASPPTMLIPIALGLSWPQRVPDAAPPVDWTRPETWEFTPLDDTAFPAVRLARDAGARGGTAPAVYNAANEACVAAFRAGELSFTGIIDVVAEIVHEHDVPLSERLTVDDVTAADTWAREAATAAIARRGTTP